MTTAFREEMRKEMDASALSSSSPPFILTSELVCRLSNDEIVNILDRIVSLLDSDSSLDDDTILRICTFIRKRLNRVYLPELFRKAGRTTEQFFSAFKTLLTLHTVYVGRSHIESLLSPYTCKFQTTFDEWDDVDLATVEMLIPMTNPNNLSFASDSDSLTKFILYFVCQILPQTRHCATRLNLPQLERLLAPSIDILCRYFIQTRDFGNYERMRREVAFVDICSLCDQRVIAQSLGRLGFFSRFVSSLFDQNMNTSESIFYLIIDRRNNPNVGLEAQKVLQNTIPCFLEEGWQDALEFLFVQGEFDWTFGLQYRTRRRMQLLGANLNDNE